MTRGSSSLLHVGANSTSLSLSPTYFEYKTVVTIVGLDTLTTVSLLARLWVNYWGCLSLSCRRQKGGGPERDGTTELSRQWTGQKAGQYNIKGAGRNRSGRYVKNPGKYRPVEAYEKAGQYGAEGGGSDDERTIHLPHSILILKSYHSLISGEASDRPWGPLLVLR